MRFVSSAVKGLNSNSEIMSENEWDQWGNERAGEAARSGGQLDDDGVDVAARKKAAVTESKLEDLAIKLRGHHLLFNSAYPAH